MQIYLSHECPLACGELIIHQSKTSEKIFFNCVMCATAFKDPKEMQNGSNSDLSRSLFDLSPEGIRLATREVIEKAGFSESITDIADECSLYSIKEITKDVYTKTHT